MPIKEAVATACRVRLRPVLMTSLATILGMIPMALALEAGSEQYAPLARAIIGGLTVSVVVTVFSFRRRICSFTAGKNRTYPNRSRRHEKDRACDCVPWRSPRRCIQ